ncbi:nuclear transport factor 2 family protein [Algoriphagus halophytocola]|uniref:Nuclear transport factor 2 family protein n=1 Tax=Algoriphagus halophytocola TaxID=2991499 RepID=A0ABY6MFM8_9BACT|nr:MULTISPECIES: nuclear transport factor 2 family protein [unclassified Algoriphagus]UZD22592.1 nuclear transport factor 2 family protein [Algoriphagus sp. TR-M5]WBL43858.1 nuclear transport factor 2 family protein [Algoriphagus sp. TR-M9]
MISKPHFYLLLFALSFYAFSSQAQEKDEEAVRAVVDLFFEALESQDSVAYKDIFFSNAQVWYVRQTKDAIKYGNRSYTDDIKSFNSHTVIKETPLDYEIKVHEEIASAWVPYTLSINGDFSHCGVDVFTLFKTNDGWKIVNISFTIEPDGCEALQSNQTHSANSTGLTSPKE